MPKMLDNLYILNSRLLKSIVPGKQIISENIRFVGLAITVFSRRDFCKCGSGP